MRSPRSSFSPKIHPLTYADEGKSGLRLIGANFGCRPNIILILRSVAKQSVSKDGNAKNGADAIMRCIGTVSVATKGAGVTPR
jgi:hypothetical protein